MLPNNSTEGNQATPAGAAEQPTSPTSGASGQPLPDYVTALQGQVAELSDLVKGIQKGTDRRFGQVQGDIKRILELKEQGLNETQIERELWIDSQMKGRQDAPVPQAAGPAKQDTSFDVEAVVQKLQFADNDPALAALRIKYQGKPLELAAAAADLRLQQLTSPNPSPATALSLGNTQRMQADAERIEQETQNYVKEMTEARGKGARFGDAIKQRYREKGVPVDSVTFRI